MRKSLLKKQLQDLKKDWSSEKADPHATVDEKLVCRVIADITGIPVSEVEEEETEKLLRMEQELNKWVIGQDEALTAVSKGHSTQSRRACAIRDGPSVPSFSWAPAGVGKTEVARRLTEFLFGDQSALIRCGHV